MAIVRIGPGQYKVRRKRPDGERKKAANAARWKLATLGVEGAAKDLGIVVRERSVFLEELLAPTPRRTAGPVPSALSEEAWKAETEEHAKKLEAAMLAEAQQPISNAERKRIKTRAWKRALLRNTR